MMQNNHIQKCLLMGVLTLLMITIVLTTACAKKDSDSDVDAEKAGEQPKEELEEKPVIYLYPEAEAEISVKLDYLGKLTCTYPKYNEGWHVIASPDGTLHDPINQYEYSYLYWEGVSDYEWPMDQGFVVRGEDTASFLREKLSYLGLIPKEYNEFIVYWLPRMENNKYNLITFPTEDYSGQAKLDITPTPDCLIRVFMVFKPMAEEIEIEEPVLIPNSRSGFTVVEWGGSEIQ
ncbi:hypothetical protein [Fusibacter ferrireducens]|uniref:Uncharacterized protein n=1 Tax=Fusibacter ferrireducens TaxID=2785058 RepID=A0ABR9ZM50_9FIRM|nr:hypothetical protein [Fusibacter ferrireducens]MBF4691535.1 hypothetical protein [Fusibacter ferrireducens]